MQKLSKVLVRLSVKRSHLRLEKVHGSNQSKMCQWMTYSVEFHQLITIHIFGLIQWGELDVLGRQSIIAERAFDSVEVMGTH